MKIAVCAKLTPDTEDVTVAASGKPDISRAQWDVSEYDLQAIQAAEDLSAEGDEVIAVTVGTKAIDQSRLTKSLMSHGNLARLVRVADDAAAGADAAVTARALAAIVKREGADLVLFGEGSSDEYARVTGSMVATELGWPHANAVDKIERDGEALVVERDMEDGVEVDEIALPCALSVTSTINIPPIPGMKAVLGAGKKPVDDIAFADLGIDAASALETVASAAPAKPGRLVEFIEGSPEEIAAALVGKLKADQVL